MAKTAEKVKKYVQSGGIEKTATKAVNTAKANPNTLLIVGGLVAGGYLLSKIAKAGDALADLGENIIGAVQPVNDGSKPAATLNPAQASNIAENLYLAMASAGTDEQRIYDALKGISYNNWVLVKNAFGQRRYNSITGEGSFFPAPLAGLGEWINAELEPDELRKLAHLAPEVFK